MTASKEEAEGETGAIGSIGQYSHMGDSLLEEERRLCYVAMTRARKVGSHLQQHTHSLTQTTVSLFEFLELRWEQRRDDPFEVPIGAPHRIPCHSQD